MSTRPARKIHGFTLPEVLVTITIIGLLAAVVIPTIAGQVKKGDTGKVGDDLAAIRGATEQFLSDVRKYPNTIGQLTFPISTSMAPLTGTSSSNYGTADVQRWRGPYLNKDSAATIATGFGLKMNGNFVLDSVLATAYDSVTTGACAAVAGCQKYIGVRISGVDSATWALIDQTFDDGNALTGTIRFKSTGASAGMKYLVLPVQ